MLIKKGKVGWINLVQPTTKELAALKKEYGFHPIIIEELSQPSARSKVEIYGDYMYIVLHFPIYDQNERVSRRGEVDFMVTKNSVITVSYEEVEPIAMLEEKIEENSNYKDRLLGADTSRLLYYLMEACLVFSLRQLKHVDEKIEDIRNNLFSDTERDLLEKISYVKRDLLSYHLIVRSQTSIFNSLSKIGPNFFGEHTMVYFSDLEGDFLKVLQSCENYKDTIESFEKTNSQILNIKMTKVMQRFSVMAFLTFPIMVFLALFTIDSSSRPIIGHTPYDFWIITGIVVFAILIMVTIFRKKDWL
ncbi:MAG TPA: magnesium transporter CorA family protein [Candidatus Magasanikbacteria bacterium]|nr:magnesium transporter CorA family protein [Candidatus Magasanikbacteria bacterium]